MIARAVSRIVAIVCICLGTVLGVTSTASAQIVLVTAATHPVKEISFRELRSIYKGRLSQVKGHRLLPLNAAPGSTDRNEFLQQVMNSSELDYTGYWHVRRYTGLGTPPAEVATREQLFAMLRQKPGSIGYLWIPQGTQPKLPDGLKVVELK